MLLLLLVAAGPAVPAARLLFLLFLLLYCSCSCCSCCCCWWWWWCWHPLMLLLLLLPRHQPRQETNSQKYRQATKSHRRSAALVEPLAKQHIQVQERPKRLQKPNSSSLARSPLLGRGRRILESNTRTPIESILTAAAAGAAAGGRCSCCCCCWRLLLLLVLPSTSVESKKATARHLFRNPLEAAKHNLYNFVPKIMQNQLQ